MCLFIDRFHGLLMLDPSGGSSGEAREPHFILVNGLEEITEGRKASSGWASKTTPRPP